MLGFFLGGNYFNFDSLQNMFLELKCAASSPTHFRSPNSPSIIQDRVAISVTCTPSSQFTHANAGLVPIHNASTHFVQVTWRHRFGSTLAQVMACCLTAPSHYMNQFWRIGMRAICQDYDMICNMNVKMVLSKYPPGANALIWSCV